MGKKLLLLFILGLSLTAVAQVPLQKAENLLDISKREQPSSGLYTGTPFVKIERTVGAPAPEQKSGWMDEEKKRLFGTTQITNSNLIRSSIAPAPTPKPISTIQEIQYKTPTGIETNAVNIPHTTDFITLIQVIDEKTLSVEEIIQTIQPQNSLFERILPANNNQSFTTDSFELIRAENNGKPFEVNVQIESQQIRIFHEGYLPAGVQSFYLKYIIHSGIAIEKGQGILDYQITGSTWPLPINRFTTLVSFPAKTTVFDKNIFFGSNEVVIRNAFSEQTDSNGNTIYQMNNPLPAFAPVKVYETFRSPFLTDNRFERFFNQHIRWFVVLLTILSVISYLGLSILWLKFKKPEKDPIQYIQSFSPATLSYLRYGRITDNYLNQSNRFLKNKSKLHHFSKTKIWKYGGKQIIQAALYFRLSGKYWLTVALMIAGMIYLTNAQKIYLTFVQYSVILVVSGITIIFFFQFWGKTDLFKEVRRYRQKLLQDQTFCGFKGQSAINLFTRHYPRLLAIGSGHDWVNLAIKTCPQISELPFLKINEEGTHE